jgi:hypothetical protein
MVKTAHSRQSPRCACFVRTKLNHTVCRRLLLQAEVGSVGVKIRQIFMDKSSQVLLIKRDHVI